MFVSFLLTYNLICVKLKEIQSHFHCLFKFVCIFHELRFYCCHDNYLACIFDFYTVVSHAHTTDVNFFHYLSAEADFRSKYLINT